MSTETFIDGLVRYIKIKEMKKTIEAVKPIKEDEDKDYFNFDISYNNIDLYLHLYFKNNDKEKKLEKIFIDEFDRTTPSITPRQPTDKGDGALLLALTIIHINKIYETEIDNVFWEGFFTDWWFERGPCQKELKLDCFKNNKSTSGQLPETAINNDNFLTWANGIYMKIEI
tara:strand:- start:1449 stop:1961 length:513 start_codon:yes stop_codon:yes gene_type:complete